MKLESGQELLHFRLVDKLGEGGMGVVWRALDTTLDREVAIKFLPETFAADPERLARFEREAKLLASLNHPHIATIHGLHRVEEARFLAMELVVGEDLAVRLERGKLPIDTALDIARQIAEALEAAHEQGVVHRDLKPANVCVGPEGGIKVLDFGLAKVLAPDASMSGSADVSFSPTLTSAGTMVGTILGTAGYMSPEQAKGKPIGRQVDVWALGAVLYQMLTGVRPFDGETISETLAAVILTDPDWDALPQETPPRIRRLLTRCLRKDPRQRLRDVGDVRVIIEEVLAGDKGTEEAAAATPRSRAAVMFPWLVAGVMAVTTAIGFWGPWRSESPKSMQLLNVDLGREVQISVNPGPSMVLSPDGKRMVFVADHPGHSQLFLREMDQLEPSELPGTKGAHAPFFSPDGQWVGFFADRKLQRVSISGGSPLELCDAPEGRGGTWLPDDTIVFAPALTSGLMKVSANGGTPEPITTLDDGERTHRWPHVLPDGETVVFSVQPAIGSYDESTIYAVNADGGERKVIHHGGTMPRYAPTGHLLYYRQGSVYAAPFDMGRLEETASPEPVITGVRPDSGSGGAQFALSGFGTFVYQPGDTASTDSTVVWLDADGKEEPILEQQQNYLAPRLSPDGRRLALHIGSFGASAAWIYDLERGTMTRATFGEGSGSMPIWSPDGSLLAYSAVADGRTPSLFRVRADGSTEAERITNADIAQYPTSFSPDGRYLVFMQEAPETGFDLVAIDLEEEMKELTIVSTTAREMYGQVSPDGRWLAYSSDESGTSEIYVRPFLRPGGKWQISTSTGSYPFWATGGRQLFYRTRDSFMVVSIETTEDAVRAGTPRNWHDAPGTALDSFPEYDVSADGKRILYRRAAGEEAGPERSQLVFILDWFDELKRKTES